MKTRMLDRVGVVLVALAGATAFSAQVPTTDVPLPGTKMQLADTSGPAGRRNFVALRDGDDSVAIPDPGVTGATVSIGRVGAGEVTVLDLPASGWSGGPQDFKFKSRSGTVIGARLLAGRSFRFTARGDGAYPLGGVPQGGVGIIIDVGGVRFCGFFGGTIVKDDGERFRARKAPAPASCPMLGTTTTTTTTTSTTSTSSTTTTSTTSSSSSTTLGMADLSLTKTAQPTTIFGGSVTVTFTLTLHNAGPDPATGVEVTDVMSPAFILDSANPSVGTTYNASTGVWSVGTLAANGIDATLGITTHADSCQPPYARTRQTNTAEVTAVAENDPDSTKGNNDPSEDDQAIASVFFGCD